MDIEDDMLEGDGLFHSEHECEYCNRNSLYCGCDQAISCECGAWIFNNDNKAVHVADCICGSD